MVDYVLQTVDLDVFGGPTSLDISTDFGKTGDRGSRFWVGNGSPNDVLTNQDIALYDMYINANTVDPYYSWLYQYVPEVGSPTWSRVLKLNPQQNSKIVLLTFANGQATYDLPISDITADTTLVASKFIIRNSFENSSNNPVASSFTYTIETILENNVYVKKLRIVLNAAEFNGTAWSKLSGSHKVHLFVSYLG